MESHPSHDEWQHEMRRELRRQRLPSAYVARLLSELDDHYEDLIEERDSSMGAARKLQTETSDLECRLGKPAQLAVFAGEQYYARSFWGRHPFVTFALGPLPLLAATWITYFAATWLAGYAVYYSAGWITNWPSLDTYNHPYLQAILLTLFVWGLVALSPAAAAMMLCRVYRRNALDWRWPALGCVSLAIVCGLIHTSCCVATDPNQGLMVVGLDVGNAPGWSLRFLPKFALALLIGLLLVKRAQRQAQFAAE